MPQAMDAGQVSQELGPLVSLRLTTACLRQLENPSFDSARIASRSCAFPFGTQVPSIGQSRYSLRNASNGEIKLARIAGTMDASSADNPSTAMAAAVTKGPSGF